MHLFIFLWLNVYLRAYMYIMSILVPTGPKEGARTLESELQAIMDYHVSVETESEFQRQQVLLIPEPSLQFPVQTSPDRERNKYSIIMRSSSLGTMEKSLAASLSSMPPKDSQKGQSNGCSFSVVFSFLLW